MSDKLITPEELANYLKVSRASVYRLVDNRKIPFCKIGGLLRFRSKDIEKYINDVSIEPIK